MVLAPPLVPERFSARARQSQDNLIAIETDRAVGEACKAIDLYIVAALDLDHFCLPLQTVDD